MTDGLPALADLDLPATVARLAYTRSSMPDWYTLADRPASQVAVLLAIGHDEALTVSELAHDGVGSYGGLHRACQELVADGLLARSDRVSTEKGACVAYHRPENEAASRAIRADGGRVTTAERSPLQSCEFYAPVGLLAQVETLVELDLYHSRSEAVRSALRREVRLQAEAPDEVGQQLQRIYDAAMQGRRPETIGELERLAELLGYDLERRVER